MKTRSHPQIRCAGLVLLAMLVFILVTTLAASTLVSSYQQASRREKEEQLLFAGDQFRRAILAYYNTIPPGGSRALPPSLEAMLEDQRFPTARHHLRRIYPDPMTGAADWELVAGPGGIIGVRSRSSLQPLKVKGFPPGYETFEDARSYSGWVFAIKAVNHRASQAGGHTRALNAWCARPCRWRTERTHSTVSCMPN